MCTGFVRVLLFCGNPAVLVTAPPPSGLSSDTEPSASLTGALGKGAFGGLPLHQAAAGGCPSLPRRPSQLGGSQVCVAGLKQEFRNLPHDGTRKEETVIPGTAAWHTAVLSAG